ncbi:Zn(2)-C6 fungal-type DNA-binding domain protein [Moelleriella libera RCEF 2490]|uniref:Zn(2)-C6 fungal-type DNA-binding domain protein n=1 Tax=Moelleriella libera RCEF 2490 TaxID=1081109 RepID=A0A167X4R4_9HYPO|nr:Zn(2)-C6 fungal-type DNA-binding domain protein [Moelleriella libera RCEF 2490]
MTTTTSTMSLFRQLMSTSKTRSSGGCWTCRVRRKKCAENRPECDTCRALEITCFFQDDKPDWMDGGPRQKEMAERIKAQVKRQASQRRDRKYLEILEVGTQQVTLSDPEDSSATGMGRGADPSPRSDDTMTSPKSSNTNESPPDIPWHTQKFIRQEDEDGAPDTDLHFLMIYLDYVFPYLFPHYRPPVLSGGRGWILEILQGNKSVYHTAISLASSFFAIVLANGEQAHASCTQRVVDRLESQLELGLKELQKEMCALNASKNGFDRRRGLIVMQSIVQMLFFEVATSNKDNWRLHLDAAIALFIQILPSPDEWTETLHGMYTPKWPPPEFGVRRPWSTAQAALRFFTATLLYLDIISSVTLSSAPRLEQYQAKVMPHCAKFQRSIEPVPAGPLSMDEFFGLPNWIIQLLGNVAALDSWKRCQKQLGTLSNDELVSRGKVLSDGIKAGIEILEQNPEMHAPPQPVFQLLVADPVTGTQAEEQPSFQMIWLLATLSYLNVVVSGWQPSSPEIRWPVSKATQLLSRLPKGTWLRALAWPMCVCGCLSLPEDEQVYRDLAYRLGPLQIFGTIKEAMDVMEKVWSLRGQIDESWDVARCLNVLGHGILLI